ncbi:SMP-30/gluconolactonase/LRE family protein [Rosenbergiella collisarenosi]|uniref:SMP-30/gluconolactonase/LRE family protein n=1 Tax=Rosenbergiella collisarenosi TaxID=1544695 RepID=UPI001F4E62F1|nr:SMP-30/gluconolactonase/LRE family protein [Rosenbergiella collisarenosi]
MNLFRMDSQLVKLCSPALWAEGPVWLPQHDSVIFSDVKGNRMFCWQRNGQVSVWRQHSNFANGNALDTQQRVISCEHGRRGISRSESDGSVTMLVDRIAGKRFNSPNDVVVKSDGTIWFTDPPYGIINDEEGFHSESQVIGCYVYCFNPETEQVKIVVSDAQRPNGLAFSPDERFLYVADMSIIDFPEQGRRELRRYQLNGESIGAGETFAEIAPGIPDGFCVDGQGNIFCSCEDGVIILDDHGQVLAKIEVPERVSNCTFGGPEHDELFITATTSLYHIRLNTHA